eukprot:g5317.t1
MKDAVPLDWYDESMVQVVMCDASELFWGVVIMQCTHEDAQRPLSERSMRPLAFYSGQFRGSQVRWGIPCKEGYAVVEALKRGEAFLGRPFQIVTDSTVIQHIFGNLNRSRDIPSSTSKRLRRWALLIKEFVFEIIHVPGHAKLVDDLADSNCAADLMTQSGASDAARYELGARYMFDKAKVTTTRPADPLESLRVSIS